MTNKKWLKMKMKMIINVLIIILMSWFVFGFVLMDFNLLNWSQNTRFWFVLSPIIYIFISVVLVVLLEVKNEIQEGRFKND